MCLCLFDLEASEHTVSDRHALFVGLAKRYGTKKMGHTCNNEIMRKSMADSLRSGSYPIVHFLTFRNTVNGAVSFDTHTSRLLTK